MKRPNSSDSLGDLMSICPESTDDHDQENNPMYSGEFETFVEGLVEESKHVLEKKRRLGVEQVKALEKNFEVENKLEPDRKVKLAQELGLQPRQVAIWFQNRRARWKTKQLERDYGILRASYDALKHNFETLQRDNEILTKEIQELKSKDGESESKVSAKEEATMVSDGEKGKLGHETVACGHNINHVNYIGNNGSSDSTDSSAILNEGNSPHQYLDARNGSTSSMNLSFKFSDFKASAASVLGDAHDPHSQPQLVKIEEHNFLDEESCSSLFSDAQAPTLQWYLSDEWS